MNGDPAAPPRRKIQALTVSVNYADYLECIAPNRRHFDRWLVVTGEDDPQTREVCRRHGMEVLVSKRLYEDGAAFHKAAALNEGLAALDQDAWVAVMDSDILLPHDFRERLDAQVLDPLCLYGLAGRRVCPTLAEFSALATREPWTDNLVYTTFVIGYFNLFHLAQKYNRYPEDTSDDASTYDVVFSDRFPAARRRYLPFVCLHAGDTSQNWRGRTTDPFLDGPAETVIPEDSTATLAASLGGPGTHAVQIGCYRGEPGRTLAQHFSRVTVIDHWGLSTRAVSEAMATDLDILRTRYERESAGAPNLSSLQEHSDETLAEIPDRSVDALWLSAEPEYDFCLKFLPAWLPKLKPGGALVGEFYSPELLPATTRLVDLLLGPPHRVYDDLRWVRHIEDPATYLRRLFPPVNSATDRGVVYVATGEHDVEPLLVSLSSLRRHWAGPVCVINAGDENPSLCLACARLGVGFRNVPDTESSGLTVLQGLSWSPFEESVYLACATLVRAPVDWLFESLQTESNAFCAGRGRTTVETCLFGWRRGSTMPEAWRSLAIALTSLAGDKAIPLALGQLLREGQLHLHPAGAVWSGPVRQIPPSAGLVALPRLARAGALHLYAPWAEEEQLLLQLLQAPV
jgi:hypothetical protein